MNANQKKFLEILFDKGETVCVSPNQYGYHSIAQEALNAEMKLTGESTKGQYNTTASTGDISLVSINPISGQRNDQNVTALRSFLIELDEGSLDEQFKYIENSGLPYSACVFSGNKSLHYVVTLEKPALDIYIWRYINQWILNILTKSDQQCKNPSRSVRFPGHIRNGKKQTLIKLNNRVSSETLNIWLNKHPEAAPKPQKPSIKYSSQAIPNIHSMPQWFYDKLEELRSGHSTSRNNDWFNVAMSMVDRNFEIEEIYHYLNEYYEEEPDFSRREWEMCIKSACRRGDIER